VKSAVCCVLHIFLFDSEIPTINKEFAAVNCDLHLPYFKITFYELLKEIGLQQTV